MQDGVASGMDHHFILILAEMLDRITLTGVAIKGRNHELLEKFIFYYSLGERESWMYWWRWLESVVMRHTRLFDLFLHKLVEILDTDELFGLSPRMVVLISRARM